MVSMYHFNTIEFAGFLFSNSTDKPVVIIQLAALSTCVSDVLKSAFAAFGRFVCAAEYVTLVIIKKSAKNIFLFI